MLVNRFMGTKKTLWGGFFLDGGISFVYFIFINNGRSAQMDATKHGKRSAGRSKAARRATLDRIADETSKLVSLYRIEGTTIAEAFTLNELRRVQETYVADLRLASGMLVVR